MSESKRETNGKPLSLANMVLTNTWSCHSDSATLELPSKGGSTEHYNALSTAVVSYTRKTF